MSQATQIKARLILPWRQIPCARKFAGTSIGGLNQWRAMERPITVPELFLPIDVVYSI